MRKIVYKLQEKIERLIEMIDKVEEVVWREYEEVVERKMVGAGSLEKLLDKLYKYTVELVGMVERLNRLRKEVSEIDEVVDRIVYLLLQLDEEGRERVGRVVEEELERMKLNEWKEEIEGKE